MTGQHHGRRSLRRWLLAAVLVVAGGRGYVGRHRLAAAALGVTPDLVRLDTVRRDVVLAAVSSRTPLVELPAAPLLRPLTLAAAPCAVVPVARSVDPLTDTVPHPVVRMFPLPVAAPVEVPGQPSEHESAEGAVFGAPGAERGPDARRDIA